MRAEFAAIIIQSKEAAVAVAFSGGENVLVIMISRTEGKEMEVTMAH